jgi:hypothetical protein
VAAVAVAGGTHDAVFARIAVGEDKAALVEGPRTSSSGNRTRSVASGNRTGTAASEDASPAALASLVGAAIQDRVRHEENTAGVEGDEDADQEAVVADHLAVDASKQVAGAADKDGIDRSSLLFV